MTRTGGLSISNFDIRRAWRGPQSLSIPSINVPLFSRNLYFLMVEMQKLNKVVLDNLLFPWKEEIIFYFYPKLCVWWLPNSMKLVFHPAIPHPPRPQQTWRPFLAFQGRKTNSFGLVWFCFGEKMIFSSFFFIYIFGNMNKF